MVTNAQLWQNYNSMFSTYQFVFTYYSFWLMVKSHESCNKFHGKYQICLKTDKTQHNFDNRNIEETIYFIPSLQKPKFLDEKWVFKMNRYLIRFQLPTYLPEPETQMHFPFVKSNASSDCPWYITGLLYKISQNTGKCTCQCNLDVYENRMKLPFHRIAFLDLWVKCPTQVKPYILCIILG